MTAARGTTVRETALHVALVNMPWAQVGSPSIQCGLLQAEVQAAGHGCDVHYLNVELAAFLGAEVFGGLAEIRSERLHLIGEWLFSYAAFGVITAEQEYYEEFPEVLAHWSSLVPGGQAEDLTRLRRETIPNWLDEITDTIDWGSYDVVGFSSTFVQNTASLALGRRLKERLPEVVLVYGGANFDGDMGAEYARKLPWLDYVVAGEGDVAFPRLLDALAAGDVPPIAGVLPGGVDPAPSARTLIPLAGAVVEPSRVHDLDALPMPDYGDYFESLRRHEGSAVLGPEPVRLPVEFARGCWWGEKHHCTFCGLNALGMGYRSKSPQRALAELTHLLLTYPSVHLQAVDNILDMKYVSSVCAELAQRHWDVHIFFEVKANLTREQLAVLKNAGILSIQPGIESLSTPILKLMRKGSTRLINIRLLKWAAYHGIRVSWNMLTGFPGETDADYREQVELMPLLHHLEPPEGCGKLWLERFSPYFTDDSFSIKNVRPRSSYRHIYPDELDRAQIAYFFDHEAEPVAGDEAFAEFSAAVEEWKRSWKARRPTLVYQRLPGRVTVIDTRAEQARRAVLSGWQGDAYEACGDTAHSAPVVRKALAAQGHTVGDDELTAFLERCCRAGIMVAEDGRYLALALPENPGW